MFHTQNVGAIIASKTYGVVLQCRGSIATFGPYHSNSCKSTIQHCTRKRFCLFQNRIWL